MGAEVQPQGGVHFRVWAPSRQSVDVVIEERTFPLEPEGGGYFSGLAPDAAAGTLYKYRLDVGGGWFPDPASRFQPHGPHGASQVVDPRTFPWTDAAWEGISLEGQVIYEMHIGTFTKEGTWDAAREQLEELAAVGVTVLELMPIAEFPGRFGWGYDGVNLFAPTWLYGGPDAFRGFVDEAHRCGLGVILDVVYNHFGPDGNYLREFSPDYFTDRYENEWGDALNFDGDNAEPVREFFTANAAYWIDEFHLDGLRLDATQQIFDVSEEHIIQAVTKAARKAAGERSIIVVAENEPQQSRLIRRYGVDALWNDDYHHSAMVALTGHNEAYYTDYRGAPQEFISAIKYGFLYQGQRYKWQKKRRGAPALDFSAPHFVAYVQNHDQVANSARGERIQMLTSPGRYRAATALLLLGPGTPMLFQGQEFAASTPFHYFADHEPELAQKVQHGRVDFLSQFRSLARPELQGCYIDPGNPSTFEASKLNFEDRKRHEKDYQMHKDLLRLRREDAVFRKQGPVDGAVLGPEAFVLRFFGQEGDDRLLLVNFGMDLHLDPAPDPLLAPPEGMLWQILWSSEHPRYGGCGTYPPDSEDNWRIPGHAAVALAPHSAEEDE